MRCLIVRPYMKPEAGEIRNELEDLQKAVGGYIEVVPLSETAAIVCNEEGKLLNLRPNRWIITRGSTDVKDVLRGTFLIVGVDGEEFTSLTDAQSDWYADVFRNNIVYL